MDLPRDSIHFKSHCRERRDRVEEERGELELRRRDEAEKERGDAEEERGEMELRRREE